MEKSVVICILLQFVLSEEPPQILSNYDRPSFMNGIALNSENIKWPSKEYLTRAKATGKYIAKNMIPTRFQMDGDNAIITYPRFRPGVPFTLGITNVRTFLAVWPQLEPFPNWDMHEEDSKVKIVNALDIFLDCNRNLWVLDIGVVNTLEDPVRVSKPKIMGINMTTGQEEHIIDVTPMMTEKSRLEFISGEFGHGKALVYVSDAGSRAIIMYDLIEGLGSRVVLSEELSCGVPRNLLYMVNVRKSVSDHELILTYLESRNLFSIATTDFKDCNETGPIQSMGVKNRKVVLLGNDNGPNVFFRYQGDNTLYRWNSWSKFDSGNFELIEKSGTPRVQTCVAPGFQDRVWVLESNIQDFVSGDIGCFGTYNLLRPLFQEV